MGLVHTAVTAPIARIVRRSTRRLAGFATGVGSAIGLKLPDAKLILADALAVFLNITDALRQAVSASSSVAVVGVSNALAASVRLTDGLAVTLVLSDAVVT